MVAINGGTYRALEKDLPSGDFFVRNVLTIDMSHNVFTDSYYVIPYVFFNGLFDKKGMFIFMTVFRNVERLTY